MMKYAILIGATIALLADICMATFAFIAQTSPGVDGLPSGTAPAGWASAVTLGTITIWLFKRDYDREKSRNDDIKTHAETINKQQTANNEAVHKMQLAFIEAIKVKDESTSLERKALAEMYVSELKNNRDHHHAVTEKNADAFLASLDQQHKHCIRHLDKHFEIEDRSKRQKEGAT